MDRDIEDIVNDLVAAGCKFGHGGPHWVRIMPPPTTDLLMELIGRGDDLSDYVIRHGLIEDQPK